jgi:hypothetical protein
VLARWLAAWAVLLVPAKRMVVVRLLGVDKDRAVGSWSLTMASLSSPLATTVHPAWWRASSRTGLEVAVVAVVPDRLPPAPCSRRLVLAVTSAMPVY